MKSKLIESKLARTVWSWKAWNEVEKMSLVGKKKMKLETTALVEKKKVKLRTTAYVEKLKMKSERSDYNYS